MGAEQKLTFKFEETGLDAVNADLAQTQQNLKDTGTAANRMSNTTGQAATSLSTSTRSATVATSNFSRANASAGISAQEAAGKYGVAAGVLGNLGTIAGQNSPKFAQMAGSIATAGSAATAAAGAFGPWGIAIGIAIAALPLLIELIDDTEEQTKKMNRQFELSTQNLDEFVSRFRSMTDLQRRLRALSEGEGSLDDVNGSLLQMTETASDLSNSIVGMFDDFDIPAGSRLETALTSAINRGAEDSEISRIINEGLRRQEINLNDIGDAQRRAVGLARQRKTFTEEQNRLLARQAILLEKAAIAAQSALTAQKRAAIAAANAPPDPDLPTGGAGFDREGERESQIDSLNRLFDEQANIVSRAALSLNDYDLQLGEIDDTTQALLANQPEGGLALLGQFEIDPGDIDELRRGSEDIVEIISQLQDKNQELADLEDALGVARTRREFTRLKERQEQVQATIETLETELSAREDINSRAIADARRRASELADSLEKENEAFRAASNAERVIDNDRRRRALRNAEDFNKSMAQTLARARNAEEAFFASSLTNIDNLIDKYRQLAEETKTSMEGSVIVILGAQAALISAAELTNQLFQNAVSSAANEMMNSWNNAAIARENALEAEKIAAEQGTEAAEKQAEAYAFAAKVAEASAPSFEEAAESILRSVVQGLAIEAGLQTLKEVAFAISSAATQDYASAGAHLAAAAAWGVVTVAAGGAAAAIGPGPTAGGIGASRPGFAPLSPDQQEDDNKGETIITINFQGDAFATRDEIGRAVQEAIDEAQRTGAL